MTSARFDDLRPDRRRSFRLSGFVEEFAARTPAEVRGVLERAADAVRRRLERELAASGLRTDYVEIVDTRTLEPASLLAPGVLVALAAFAGQTRLIDNCEL